MDDNFRFRFSSKYLDEETGLYYYGYRYLSPVLGRWVNRDPIGETGGLSLYCYLENGTINVFDFLGMFGFSDCNDLVAAVKSSDFLRQFEDYVRVTKSIWPWKKDKEKQCLVDIVCNECCTNSDGTPSDRLGAYDHKSGIIEICSGNIAKDGNPLDKAKETILHEVSHAARLCRTIYNNCGDCLEEEMLARRQSGQDPQQSVMGAEDYCGKRYKNCGFTYQERKWHIFEMGNVQPFPPIQYPPPPKSGNCGFKCRNLP